MDSLITDSQIRTSFGVSYDTIFTVVTSLTVFALGLFVKWLGERAQRNRKQRELRSFLFVYLSSLIDPLEKQMSAFKILSSDARSKLHKDLEYGDSLGVKLDVLDGLPQVEVFSAFVSGPRKSKAQRINQFNLVLDAIDYARRIRESAKHQFKEFVARLEKYLEQWNNSINFLLRYQEQLVSLAMRTKVTPEQDPFLKDFNFLFRQLMELENQRDMDQVAEHFLEPLRQLCKRHSTDERVHVIIPPVLDCLQARQNRSHALALLAHYFDEQVETLAEKRDALKHAITRLEETA